MLKIKQLSLKKILKEISLEIPEKRITLLLGKSGSGKTSLLRCIAQLEKGYTGTISLQHQDLSQLSAKERCRMVGFVPQFFALFPNMTILDNCAQSLRLQGQSKEASYEKAQKLLASLDMTKLTGRKPHELSGGQQQRAAIARALVLDPSFLLFDEPTSALDPENTDLFVDLLRQCKGKGILIATQDMSFAAKILDRAYFLENGSVIEEFTGSKPLDMESKLGKFFLVKKYGAGTSRELNERANSTDIQQDYAVPGLHGDYLGD